MLADLRNSSAFRRFAALLPFVPTRAPCRWRVWSTGRTTRTTDSSSTQREREREKKLLQCKCVHHKPYTELASDLWKLMGVVTDAFMWGEGEESITSLERSLASPHRPSGKCSRKMKKHGHLKMWKWKSLRIKYPNNIWSLPHSKHPQCPLPRPTGQCYVRIM